MSQRTLAILGGGQLGMLLAEAADRLGVRARCFDTNPQACAAQACLFTPGSFADMDAVRSFCQGADAVTCEWESIPLESLRAASEVAPLLPGLDSFASARDRFAEYELFERAGVKTPSSVVVRDSADIRRARAKIPGRMVCKSRFDGYDGHGQFRFGQEATADEMQSILGQREVLCQAFVPFDREVSVVLVRDQSGQIETFPVCENVHDQGILIQTCAPAAGNSQALEAARRVADAMNHVGVLAVEFFQVGDEIVANEVAPRVHNSGHWTLCAPVTQFSQHVRAVLGMPIERFDDPGAFAMLNVIGWSPASQDVEALAQIPGVDLRMYGKTERPGRKLGHVSIRAESREACDESLAAVRAIIGSPVLRTSLGAEG